MAGTSAAKGAYLPVSLKAIVPVIPKSDREKAELIEDLTKMGCEGLMVHPWDLRSEEMVQEFQRPRSNEWENTIRRDPNHWTAELWADVYMFRKEGRMRAGRTGTWVDGKFRQDINSKDGYAVSDCIDPRERRVLEFVVPIFYPEKPGRVTKEIGNTIFGALSGEYQVSWGQVIHELVDKLVSVLHKRKPTPVSPYLFHLYHKNGCLRKEEEVKMEVAQECLEVGFESEKEAPGDDESDRASLSPNVEPQVTPSPGKRMKTTYRSPKGKSPIRNFGCLDDTEDPFVRLQDAVYQVQSRYNKMGVVIRGATKLLGDCKAGNVSKEIKKLQEESGSGLKAENEKLKLQIAELQGVTKTQGVEIERLQARNADLGKIRDALVFPGDVINRSLLFTEDIRKEGHMNGQKILTILVKYGHKMDAILQEMRKLLPGTVEVGSSHPEQTPPPPPSAPSAPSSSAAPPAASPPPKGRFPILEASGGEVQPAASRKYTGGSCRGGHLEAKVPPPQVPAPSPKGKKTESGTAAASSEPTSEKDSARKRKQVVTPEPKQAVVLSDSGSTEEEEEDEEEEEEEAEVTPLMDRRRTRSSEKQKPPPYRSAMAPKRQAKSAEKGEGSRKRTKK